MVSATVSPAGTLSPWTTVGMLPGPRSHFSVSLLDGYIYLTGGLDVSAFQNPPNLPDVVRAQIAADGTVGPWTTLTPLPVPLATHASFFYGGYLYVGGGISGTTDPLQENRVWRAPIAADHTLGAWELAAPLLIARSHVLTISPCSRTTSTRCRGRSTSTSTPPTRSTSARSTSAGRSSWRSSRAW